jgi:transposase-like protein
MGERPGACPACGGTVLIRSGHACGRQRWKCKGAGCGRQFTRTGPRGKPAALKRQAIELYWVESNGRCNTMAEGLR